MQVKHVGTFAFPSDFSVGGLAVVTRVGALWARGTFRCGFLPPPPFFFFCKDRCSQEEERGNDVPDQECDKERPTDK